MAIIYTFPLTSNFKSDDCFVISDGSDNKTKKLSASGLLSWIDDNLSYDLQQVLNSGSDADMSAGTWTNIQIWRDKSTQKRLLYLDPSTSAQAPDGTLEVHTKLEMNKDASSEAVIESPFGDSLMVKSGDRLNLLGTDQVYIATDSIITHSSGSFAGTYASSFLESLTEGDYSTQVQSGKYGVTTNEGKQVYMSAGEPTGFEFLAVPGTPHVPNFHLKDSINLYIQSTVTDSLGVVGTAGEVLKSDANGFLVWATDETVTPGGGAKSVQFNNGGNPAALDGDAFFIYDTNAQPTLAEITLGTSANHGGSIKLHSDGDNSEQARIHFVDTVGAGLKIQAPLTYASAYELTLPVDGPSAANSCLVSDANGTMSFTTLGSSGAQGLIQFANATGGFDSDSTLKYDNDKDFYIGLGSNSNTNTHSLTIGANGSKGSNIRLFSGGGGYVALRASNTSVNTVSLTFPDDAPNAQGGQVLQSDGTGQLSWINTPSAGSGTQYSIPLWDNAAGDVLADSLLSQPSSNNMVFGASSLNGKWIDFKNHKIAFDGDNTNTFIMADTSSPESLEIHADEDVVLKADNYVVIEPGIGVPATGLDLGRKGSITFDDNYLYIAIDDDDWRKVALSTI